MQTETVTAKEISEMELSEINAMLETLNFDDLPEEETEEGEEMLEFSEADLLLITEETVIESEEPDEEEIEISLLAQAMKTIEKAEAMAEIYEEQESGDDHVEVIEKTKAQKVMKKEKLEKAIKSPRSTTHTHSIEDLVKERANPNFYLLVKSDLELDAEGQKLKHDEVLALVNGMNVKGRKKCLNFLSAVNGSAKMSTFIDQGIRYLLGDNAMTKADLEAYFISAARNKVKAYNKSTAMPQALNLLKLFTDLKMIVKEGAVYKINDESLLMEQLTKNYGKGA